MIISSVDLGKNLLSVEVDADPLITSVDVPKGSIILWNGILYDKLDNGDTTNSVLSHENLRSVLVIKTSNKAGGTYLNHNTFTMGASGTSAIEWQLHVPISWDETQDPKMHAVGVFDAAGTSDDVVFEFALEKTANGEIMDGVDDLVLNYTEPVPDTQNQMYYTDLKTMDAGALGLAANDHLRVEFRRIGGDAADTRSGAFRLLHVMVIFPRKSSGVTL